MSIRGGYGDRLLRIDLGSGTVSKEELPVEDVLRRYVGGTGLGLYYLLRDAPRQAKALDPDAPLIFMLGPLTGTPAINSSDWTTVCYDLCIPYAAGIGHGHGFWGAYLKHAGYQGIYLHGQSDHPVYLWIDDSVVELRDARHLWGLDTRETERRLKLELGDEENVSVACVGPAGEAELPGAMVKADRHHGSGKGSPGAVMGSKKLKAIAVRGTRTVPLSDAAGLVEASAQWEQNLSEVSSWLQDGGITRNYFDPWDKDLVLVAQNAEDPLWGTEFARKYVEACRRWKVTSKPSYNCKISCAYDVEITDGVFAGFIGSPCGGAESMEGAAALIGVDDPSAVVVITDFYDGLGLESGQFGDVVGAAVQAFNQGMLTREDTGDLDLTWGNWQTAMELVDQAVRGEGLGARLADVVKARPELLGREKGVVEELRRKVLGEKRDRVKPDYRGLWGQLTGGTSESEDSKSVAAGAEDNLEDAPGKVDTVRRRHLTRLWEDTLGICLFSSRGVKDSLHLTSLCLANAVGWKDFSPEEAIAVGERVANLMRLVYAVRGFNKADELAAPAGDAKDGPHLIALAEEYYRQMGWAPDTGLPTADTLRRLGVEEFSGETV
jgi:aldehyde:ferredoxin oxidoreductase